MAKDFIILLSPSLGMDFKSPAPAKDKALYLQKAGEIMSVLKQLKKEELSKMIKTSDLITESVLDNINSWSKRVSPKKSKAAIHAFSGVVYQGLQAHDLSSKQIALCQKRIRIISGLYGYLKPLDAIQPYRLEMKTVLKVGEHTNLYKYWGDAINKAIAKEEGDTVLNLSSKEYSKLVSDKSCGKRIVTIDFKNRRNGKLTLLSYHAKRARGYLAHEIITSKTGDIEAIKKLTIDGYRYSARDSSEDEWLFVSNS